jgi:Fe-S cluster assembly protein SufD
MPAPTRHDEAWRYSDIAAVEAAWPLPAPESIIVPAGGNFTRTIVQDKGAIHQLDIAIGKGATAAIYILNIVGDFGRVELNVTLHEGANFKLCAVQIGGNTQTLEIITTVTHVEPNATSSQIVRSVLAGTVDWNLFGQGRRCARCATDRQRAVGEGHVA